MQAVRSGPASRTLARLAVITAMLMPLMLVGCNLMRTAYDNADWFLANRADEFFDLDTDQDDWLRERIRLWQAAQGRPLLLDYREALDQLHRDASDGLTAAEARQALDQAERLLKVTMGHAIPIMADLLARLEPHQIDYLAEVLEERNQEYRSKYLHGTLAERTRARADRVVNRVERWTGSLERPQRALVRQMANDWPDITEAWLNYRVERQQAMLNLLRGGADPARIRAFLQDWVVERAGMPDSLRVNREAYRTLFVDLVSVLDPTLEPDQREEFLTTVGSYRDRIDDVLAD